VTGLEGVLRSIVDRPGQARALSAFTCYPKTTRAMTEEALDVYAQATTRGSAT
jgi:hypothetical protein